MFTVSGFCRSGFGGRRGIRNQLEVGVSSETEDVSVLGGGWSERIQRSRTLGTGTRVAHVGIVRALTRRTLRRQTRRIERPAKNMRSTNSTASGTSAGTYTQCHAVYCWQYCYVRPIAVFWCAAAACASNYYYHHS